MKSSISKFFTLIGLALFITSVSSQAQDPFADDFGSAMGAAGGDKASASIISSVETAAPGKPFTIAIKLDHPGDWHSYYKNAGAVSMPLNLKLDIPEGYTASEIKWPVPQIKWVYDVMNYMYGHKAYFLVTITPPADAKVGSDFTIKASARVQLCNDNGCLPPDNISASTTLIITEQAKQNAQSTDIINKAKNALPTPAEEWQITAKQVERNLVLLIKTETDLSQLKNPVFISDLPFTDTEKKQTLKQVDGGYELTVPIKKDENAPQALTGILTNETNNLADGVLGVLVNIKAEGAANGVATEPANDSSAANPVATKDSEDSQKKRLALVPDSPVISIPISRLNDDGFVVNDDGKVIPPSELFVDENGNITNKEGKVTGKKQETTFLIAMAFIFGGGLILNLMPCVFPVLGVKVLGFAQLAGNDPKKIKMHGLVFTLGVLVSMWILAGTILAIKASTGDAVAWGSQMKSPIFVGSMVILLTLFAMNLFGIFEVGTSLTSAGGNLQSKKGYQGSFFSGILTTLIATPCGAPLLATAMTYTLQQSALIALFLFTIFGLGVAFPYLVLSFFPKMIDKLPRPGNWMVTFKKSMAFPLLATVAFLLTVFVKQTGEEGIVLMIWSLVIFATAAFVYGTWSPRFTPAIRRYVVGFSLTIILATGAGYLAWQAMNTERNQTAAIDHEWTGWEPTIVDNTRKKGRIVWIDYTADW